MENKKPLYVKRELLNANDLIRYVKSFGVETTLAPDDMHVTIVYSRTPVDMTRIETVQSGLHILPKMDRQFHVFDPPGCLVLKIQSAHLANRNMFYRSEYGCSYDFPEYLPHVTVTYNLPDQNVLDNLLKNPYCGLLEFGPEIAKELDPDFKPKDIKEG